MHKDDLEIRDGGNVVLQCNKCDSNLVVIWITRPEAEFDWKLRANCPYCGHSSNEYDVHGVFHYGPYHRITNQETMENEGDLYIETFTEQDGIVDFLVKRHSK